MGIIMSTSILRELEPKIIWKIFEELTKIYRPSKGEEKIRHWIKKWSEENKIKYKDDLAGNILLVKEASVGCENYPTLVLQGHLDMVYQKEPDCPINFETDPLSLKIIEKECLHLWL